MLSWPTLYRFHTSGVSVWKLRVEAVAAGYDLVVEQGLGGDLTQTRKTIKARSESDAKRFAQAVWNRQQARRGYTQSKKLATTKGQWAPAQSIKISDFSGAVDWSLAFAQPKYDDKRFLLQNTGDKWEAFGGDNVSLPRLPKGWSGLALEVAQGGNCIRVYDLVGPESFFRRYVRLKALKLPDPFYVLPVVTVTNVTELRFCEAYYRDRGAAGLFLRWGQKAYEPGRLTRHLLDVDTRSKVYAPIVDYRPQRGFGSVLVCEVGEHYLDVCSNEDPSPALVGKIAVLEVALGLKTGEEGFIPFFPKILEVVGVLPNSSRRKSAGYPKRRAG